MEGEWGECAVQFDKPVFWVRRALFGEKSLLVIVMMIDQ